MKYRIVSLFCGMMLIVMCVSGCGLFTKEEPDVVVQESGSEISGENSETQTLAFGFTTTDLYGNEVTEAVFSQSELTVLNIWATYCGPCINEMPHLGELAKEYDSAKVQIIGVPTDVVNQEYLEYAMSLISETGADYTHLLLNQELYDWGLQDIQYVPTTFFINREGEIIDTVVGSLDKESWKELIDEKLASL